VLLVIEIAMLIGGIVAMATGKLSLTKSKVYTGVGVRIAGLMLVLPLPVALLVGLVWGSQLSPAELRVNAAEYQVAFILVELLCIVIPAVLAVVFVATLGEPSDAGEKRRRRDDLDYDEPARDAVPARPAVPAPLPTPHDGYRTSVPARPVAAVPQPPRSYADREDDREPRGLSGWMIAGIVGASLLVVATIGIVVWVAVSKAENDKVPVASNPPPPGMVRDDKGPRFVVDEDKRAAEEERRKQVLAEMERAQDEANRQRREANERLQRELEDQRREAAERFRRENEERVRRETEERARREEAKRSLYPKVVRPPTQLLAMQPTPMTGEKETVNLSGKIANVCVGGGGRFLILDLPEERSLAVFDANVGKIVKKLPMAEDNVLFAAGMEKLLVVLPGQKAVQRWSLTSFEQEASAPIPFKGTVRTASMGSASGGCLVLGGPELAAGTTLPVCLLDIDTLKEVPLGDVQGRPLVGRHPQYPAAVHVSADGSVIGMHVPGQSPSGFQTVVFDSSGVKCGYQHRSVGEVIPGPDGQAVFTSAGVYTGQLQVIVAPRGRVLPAAHGNCYLTVEPPNKPAEGDKTRLAVQMLDLPQPLLTLDGCEGSEMPRVPPRDTVTSLTVAKRFHLLPLAQLLVVIPLNADRLILYRVDIDRALEASRNSYVAFTSRPDPLAVRGKTYEYRPVVKAKEGGVTIKLESGPEGMQVNDGVVTWAVPPTFKDAVAEVSLVVGDAPRKQTAHRFRLRVEDGVK
jgi:hypothetical protein